jgi:hypothetical protein
MGVVLLLLGSLLITRSSLVYFGDDLTPFAIEKFPLPDEERWLDALRVHVAAAAFALPACLVLLSTSFLRREARAHRWLGRATGVVVLFLLVPSGTYLALHAKGGLASTIGFLLSGAIVAGAMIEGVRTARARRFALHRRWALHVLAQLSVAVTSRAMLFGFDALGVDETNAYLISLWLPVVGSAILVELMTTTRRRSHAHAADPRLAPRRLVGLRRAGDVA